MFSIRKAIFDDPGIVTNSLEEQFDNLLLQPLLDLELPNERIPTVVIVIDAVDECEHNDDIRVVLRALLRLRESNSIKIRIFLTSRPEFPIRIGFLNNLKLDDCQDLVPHEIPIEVTIRGIFSCLTYRLSKIEKE